MDIKTASIKELYNDMSEKWEILSELFSKQDERGKPGLAVFNANYRKTGFFRNIGNFWRVLYSLKFCPDDFPEKEESNLCREIIENYITAFYSNKYHAVVMNRAEIPQDLYQFAMAEEVTHSVVHVNNGMISVSRDEAAAFKGYSAYFGLSLVSSLRFAGLDTFNADMDEFFPPLGQSHFLGKEVQKYDWALDEQVSSMAYFHPERARQENADEISRHMHYISSVAGFMLVKQYKHDVRALLREHPSLANLDGKQVWKMYCRPLLIHGKL
jgi:hypothetical protein